MYGVDQMARGVPEFMSVHLSWNSGWGEVSGGYEGKLIIPAS